MLSRPILAQGAAAIGAAARTSSSSQFARALSSQASSTHTAATLSWPFSRVRAGEPSADFTKLRNKPGLARVKMWDGSEAWLATRYKDVCAILMDGRFSKVRTHPNFPELSAGGKLAAKAGRPTFVDMDAPEHTQQRGLVEPSFDLAAVRTPEMKALIQTEIDAAIKNLKLKGEKGEVVDFNMEFAQLVPTNIIYHILGVPHRDQEYLNQCNAVRTSASATSGEAAQANKDLVAYLHRLVEAKAAAEPSNDFISTLVHKYVRAGELDMEDATQITFLMLVAGNATVVGMLNLGVVELLQRPAQLAALKAEPRLWPNAIEELLRFHTASALATRRVALQDVRVGGTLIQAGEPVIASNQSANRDPTVFADPDQFNVFRSPNPHLAFGFGAHLCVAEWLCRAELIPAFETLFKEVPNLKLAVEPSEIGWSPLGGDVGITKLPVHTQ